MDIASSRPQTNTEIIMDLQSEIKEFVKNAVLNSFMIIGFNEKVMKMIVDGLEPIDDENLKEIATRTLFRFAQQEFRWQSELLGLGILPVALATYNREQVRDTDLKVMQEVINKTVRELPLEKINQTYSQLGNSQAKVSFGQSLYGRAELNARYQEQQKMVRDLREKTQLVICDTYSDCSDRCKNWQGRVYSLNGTSGRTEDGKEYIPLETATNAIFKGHRNGLLGYNCRHKLVPYKTGMSANKVSETERKREYEITNQQRLYEREIRKHKDLASSFKRGSQNTRQFNKQQIEYMNSKYQEHKYKADMLTQQYYKFCEDNNRVKYRSRISI